MMNKDEKAIRTVTISSPEGELQAVEHWRAITAGVVNKAIPEQAGAINDQVQSWPLPSNREYDGPGHGWIEFAMHGGIIHAVDFGYGNGLESVYTKRSEATWAECDGAYKRGDVTFHEVPMGGGVKDHRIRVMSDITCGQACADIAPMKDMVEALDDDIAELRERVARRGAPPKLHDIKASNGITFKFGDARMRSDPLGIDPTRYMQLGVVVGDVEHDVMFHIEDGDLVSGLVNLGSTARDQVALAMRDVQDDLAALAISMYTKEHEPTPAWFRHQAELIGGAINLGARGSMMDEVAVWETPPNSWRGEGYGWLEFGIVDGEVVPTRAAYGEGLTTDMDAGTANPKPRPPNAEVNRGTAYCADNNLRLSVDFVTEGEACAEIRDMFRLLRDIERDGKRRADEEREVILGR